MVDPNSKIQTRHYPLAFGYLVSYGLKGGLKLETRYYETNGDPRELWDSIHDFKPSVVALSCVTENFNLARSFADFVKGFFPKATVLIGGPHISAVPTDLTSHMDVGIIGEGEQTFLDLANNDFHPTKLIDGLVYRDDQGLQVTGKRRLIEPIDKIPYPRRDIFGSDLRAPYIFTSRGCPYGCSFCSSSKFWGRVRLHSPEYVAGEIDLLRRAGCREIVIYDDCFILSEDRVKRISQLVQDWDLSFKASVRANLVTDSVVRDLKAMGVKSVGIGIESNSARILEILGKMGNSPEINQRAIDILKRHGIGVTVSLIKGVPTETKADLKATMDFVKKNDLNFDLYDLVRFPNTPLYGGSTDWDACKISVYKLPFLNRAIRFARRRVERFINKSGVP